MIRGLRRSIKKLRVASLRRHDSHRCGLSSFSKQNPHCPSCTRGLSSAACRVLLRRTRLRRFTNRHDSSCFESFRSYFALFWSFGLAISEPGCTSRKKVPLGIRLKSTRPSHGRVLPKLHPPEAKQNFLRPGLCRTIPTGRRRTGRQNISASRTLVSP